MNFNSKNHWEEIYTQKKPTEVSWYQIEPIITLELIKSIGIEHTDKIIDVGGGASVLVDKLLDTGFQDITILDISLKALCSAKERLGSRAEIIKWIEADVTEFEPQQKYDLWHDRAVFHFLTSKDDRKKYVQNMGKSLNSGGHVIISTFAVDGPTQCSGLDIVQYNPEKMKNEIGDFFELTEVIYKGHITPWGKEQKFMHCSFRKL